MSQVMTLKLDSNLVKCTQNTTFIKSPTLLCYAIECGLFEEITKVEEKYAIVLAANLR